MHSEIASSTHINMGFNNEGDGDADDEEESYHPTSGSASGETTEDLTCDESMDKIIDKSIPLHSTRAGNVRMAPISPISKDLPHRHSDCQINRNRPKYKEIHLRQ